MDEENIDIMEPTGKNDKILTSYNGVFTNASALFIEYDDILKCPFYTFLCIMSDNEEFGKMFDMSEIKDLDVDDIFQYYISRKEKNIFKALKPKEYFNEAFSNYSPPITIDDLNDKVYENLLKLQMDTVPEIVTYDPLLNFHYVLSSLQATDLVENIYIWSPFDSNVIRDDINKYYRRARFVYGGIKDVLSQSSITEDTTFIFSDVKNILALKDVGKLNYSSILIPDGYRYNYIDDKKSDFCIDMESIYKENYIFHLTFFDNFYR
jgi:hypothetical protein